jgi:hypothetical protein
MHGTLNSRKVRCKGLEDEGTAKRPLPMLKGYSDVIIIRKHFRITYLFVLVFRVLIQKTKFLEVVLGIFLPMRIRIPIFRFGVEKSHKDQDAVGSNDVAPRVCKALNRLRYIWISSTIPEQRKHVLSDRLQRMSLSHTRRYCIHPIFSALPPRPV